MSTHDSTGASRVLLQIAGHVLATIIGGRTGNVIEQGSQIGHWRVL